MPRPGASSRELAIDPRAGHAGRTPAGRRDRPRLELLAPRRLHLFAGELVEADRRALRDGSDRGGPVRLRPPQRGGDRARPGDAVACSAASARPTDWPRRTSTPSPPARSATPPTRTSSSVVPRRPRGSRSSVLSAEDEARYGYVAAVNTTTLDDGVVVELGGGSMQLSRSGTAAPQRSALVPARSGPPDRGAPAGLGTGQEEGPQPGAGPRASRRSRTWTGSGTRASGLSGWAARPVTSPPRRSAPPGSSTSGSRASSSPPTRCPSSCRRSRRCRAPNGVRCPGSSRVAGTSSWPRPSRSRRSSLRGGVRRDGGHRGRAARGRVPRRHAARAAASRCSTTSARPPFATWRSSTRPT